MIPSNIQFQFSLKCSDKFLMMNIFQDNGSNFKNLSNKFGLWRRSRGNFKTMKTKLSSTKKVFVRVNEVPCCRKLHHFNTSTFFLNLTSLDKEAKLNSNGESPAPIRGEDVLTPGDDRGDWDARVFPKRAPPPLILTPALLTNEDCGLYVATDAMFIICMLGPAQGEVPFAGAESEMEGGNREEGSTTGGEEAQGSAAEVKVFG